MFVFVPSQPDYNTALVDLIKFAYEKDMITVDEVRAILKLSAVPHGQGAKTGTRITLEEKWNTAAPRRV